jgi:hypothetical protein
MPNTRTLSAERLSAKLHAFEAAIDEALACAGDLTTTISQERKRAQLSAIVGQDAIAHVGRSLASLHAARAEIVASHMAFEEVRDQLGIPATAGGSLWKFARASTPLQLVAERAA